MILRRKYKNYFIELNMETRHLDISRIGIFICPYITDVNTDVNFDFNTTITQAFEHIEQLIESDLESRPERMSFMQLVKFRFFGVV